MDKRAKKRIQGLRTKIDGLRRRLAGAQQQADDPGEERRVRDEISKCEAEIEKRKARG